MEEEIIAGDQVQRSVVDDDETLPSMPIMPSPSEEKTDVINTVDADSDGTQSTEKHEEGTTTQAQPTAEPKIIKKGDKVITSYVDEKTGKIAAYEPGIKLEVSDFAGTWYPAKVVEIDTRENEILVHFENWSSRFDEWIKMDSNRLRPTPNTNVVKTTFKVGEQVEALWGADGQRYSGEILSILPNDYYQVLFDDGIRYKKKYNQIFKLKVSTRGSGRLSTDCPSTPPTTGPPITKSNRPLPKLFPAPFLLGNNDRGFSQQAVASLPPNVPLFSGNVMPKGRRISQPQAHPAQAPVIQFQQQDEEQLSLSHQMQETSLTSKSHFSVFAPISTDLGKRKRTVKDYSQLLKTPSLKPVPVHNEVTTVKTRRRRRNFNKPVEDLNVMPINIPAEKEMGHLAERRGKSFTTQSESQFETDQPHDPPELEAINVDRSNEHDLEYDSIPPSKGAESNFSEAQPKAKVSVTPGTTPAVTPEAPLTKRKRTVHDYSMLLNIKTRASRSSFSSLLSDPSPKTRRKRTANVTSTDSDQTAAQSTSLTDPSLIEKSKSPDPTVCDARKESSDLLFEKGFEKTAAEKPLPDTQIAPISKRHHKKPQTLIEFDMFAPKKKILPPQSNRGQERLASSEKSNKENSNNVTSQSGFLSKASVSASSPIDQSKLRYEDDSDEELLDIPDYALRDNSEEQKDLDSRPPFLNLRRPGRPFKKNRPPPGHWSYDGKPASSSVSEPADQSVVKVKAGPKVHTVARHSVTRFMKNLKIPIVPVKLEKDSNGLLHGLSSKKVDTLQQKLLQKGKGFKLDIEPTIKDVSVDVINCSCGSVDEHGLMIQCEFCQCWQHGNCFGYTEDSEMPSYYVCDSCRFPFHARESMANEWNQEFKRKGRLPRITLETQPNPELERVILESTELQDRIYQILDIVHSNRLKLQIANKIPEHLKIYQWDKPSLNSSEDLRMRMYNKIYKPVLRRLLYANRSDTTYQDKLKQRLKNHLLNPDLGNKETSAEYLTPAVSIEDALLERTENIINDELKNIHTDTETRSQSTDDEVRILLRDMMTQVENTITQNEMDDANKFPRPLDLNIISENVDRSVKLNASDDLQKKGHTPLEDLNMLGSIGELSTKVDPDTDDLFMSIFNDPDFEKSFDAPLTVGTLKPQTQSLIVPTLARITPELCRENLISHITDQQEVVNKCLQIVEEKILAMERARMKGIPSTPFDCLKLHRLQMSVKRLLAALESTKAPCMSPRPTNFSAPSGIENDQNHIASQSITSGEDR